MPTIFLDESGYTGPDFLNEGTPIFVIASIGIEESECIEIKREFFGSVQARELKHSVLGRRPRQREMVLKFLEYLTQHKHLVELSVAHKKFALVCKSVDLLVETAAHDSGFNLYEGGANKALSNLIFFTLPHFLGGPATFDEFLAKFQTMLRERSTTAYDDFFALVWRKPAMAEGEDILDYFRLSDRMYGYNIYQRVPADTLDLGFTMALWNLSIWSQRVPPPLQLIHDESTNMSKQKNAWDALTDISLGRNTFEIDGEQVHFPIALVGTAFESSDKWAGLQLADVVAGATARYARWIVDGGDANDSYGKRLADLIEQFHKFAIWPNPEDIGKRTPTAGEEVESLLKYISSAIR